MSTHVLSKNPSKLMQWINRLWVPIILVVISLGYSGAITLMHTKALSPLDEWVYSDYLDKVPTQLMVRQGEYIGHTALERIACNGIFPYGQMGQPCGSSLNDPSKFPFGGKTTADAYTPFYFATTWATGEAIHTVLGVDELTGWRLVSTLWLAATMVLLFILFKRFRVPSLLTIALGLAFIASPYSWWTYTYVSTDTSTAFFGLLLLILTFRFLEGKSSAWPLVIFSAVAVLFKITNVLGVCLAALIILLTWLWELRKTSWEHGWRSLRPDGSRRSLSLPLFGVISIAAAVLAELGWLKLRTALAVGPAPVIPDSPLGIHGLLEQTMNFLPGTITSNVVVAGGNGNFALPLLSWMVQPLAWICIAGVAGAFMALRVRSTMAPLTISVFVSSVLFAPMLALFVKIFIGSYFVLPSRYGGVLLGAFLLMAALTMRNRYAAWLILAYSTTLGIVLLVGTHQLMAHA